MTFNKIRRCGVFLLAAVLFVAYGYGAQAGAEGTGGKSGAAGSANLAGKMAAALKTAAVPGKAAGALASGAAGRTAVVAADPVPGIISSVTPSVVGIIGTASSSGDSYGGDFGDYGGYDDYSTESAGNTVKSSLGSATGSTTGSATGSTGGNSGGSAGSSLAHGTGIIITSNGWIITNAHVIDGIEDPTIVISSGKKFKIKQSYIDELSDLALIRINASGLKPALLAPASRSVQVGEKVVALGTPVSFALRGSATEGIVSGIGRSINAAYKLIQTDAAINPGNSGGPLLNMKGEVIGVNSMKYEAVGVESIGFSIPISTVHYVMDQLFQYGEVLRPSLGMLLEESESVQNGIPGDDPLTVTKVTSSAAGKAGFKAGDKIYKVNNAKLTSLVDLNELLKQFKPGQTVTVWTESKGDIVKRTLQLASDSGDNEAGEPASGEGNESL